MDPVDLAPQVEDLEANIDDLEDALEPLLQSPLLTTASTLPLLDKAKLYVLSSYAIESLLFSTLQASGVNAKEHAIFEELARLKTYFKKIKDAELGPEPKARIDKEAVGRFIRHGLAGNDKYDAERAERIAKEKARAALKAKQVNIKFDQAEESAKMAALPKSKRTMKEVKSSDDEENDVDSENVEMYGEEAAAEQEQDSSSSPAKKKQRISAADLNDAYDDSVSASTSDLPSASKSKRSKHSLKRGKHLTDERGGPKSLKELKTERKVERKQRKAEKREKNAEMVIPPKEAPRSHSETFNALLDGSLKKKNKKGKAK